MKCKRERGESEGKDRWIFEEIKIKRDERVAKTQRERGKMVKIETRWRTEKLILTLS